MAKKYDAAFKEQAVQLVTELKKPVATVAQELGIPDTTLHQWLKNAREHPERPFVGSGKLRAADQEAREFQRRIRDLEEEWESPRYPDMSPWCIKQRQIVSVRRFAPYRARKPCNP